MLRIIYWDLRSIYRDNIVYLITKRQRNARLNQFINNYGGKALTVDQAKRYKKKNKLFILGCGPSINCLSKNHQLEIQNNDSIGINKWAYHDLVPTYYSLELGTGKSPKDKKDNLDLVSEINRKWEHYKESAFIVKQREIYQTEVAELLKKISCHGNLYWNHLNVIPGASSKVFSHFLNLYYRIGLLDKSNFFVNKAASIIWCLGLAYKLKYEKIILTGVDLYGDYFFVNQEHTETCIEHENILHKTADPKRVCGGVTVFDIVYIWNEYIFKPNNIELFVGHEKSLLSHFLPVWDNF